LVRGLDYYTRTVFEVFHREKSTEKNSQDPDKPSLIALAGGGRYDGLIELLGGGIVPGCGVAVGIERVIKLMKQREVKIPEVKKPKLFLAQLGSSAKAEAFLLFEELRKAKIPVTEDFPHDSLKSQLARANRLGIRYVLILGQKEVIDNVIILRDMEEKSQETIKLSKVVKEVKKKIKSN